jgi:filamentous hemagglutinin family protein
MASHTSSRRASLRNGVLLVTVSAISLLGANNGALARALNGSSPAVSAPSLASDAAALAAQQAAAAARQTQGSLARAARALQDMQGLQAAARAAAAAQQTSVTAPVAVPNGLGAGGLLPNMPAGWSGANAPIQGVDSAGQTQVNIRQTTQQAILNWTSFNVGARTTLTFDQQGNANWVALNRVDASTGPSQILGNIKADGQVYVINQSGIIFGGNSQINVGSLIASTAGITDSQFRTNGIYATQSGAAYLPSFTAAGGKVVVEAGASISTSAPSSVTSGGGFVLMIGSEVVNAGAIATPKGQTILAAGDDFILRRGYGTDANQFSTTNGSEIAPVIRAGSSAGKVTNTGVVLSQQGDITLAGRAVTQDGVLFSTTSVHQRGTIHLLNAASDTSGSVTITGKSLSWILPELESKDTALNAQRDALIAASGLNPLALGQFDNLSLLTDRRDQSRVEIVTGGLVNVQNGSLTMAQGGQVAVSAGKRVFAATGSVIDVSGVQGALRPMSANQVQVNVQGNELRDSPVNRDSGVLINKNVWIDIRDLIFVPAGTGGYAGERYYTKGGLLEVGGYLANTTHTIGEWAALGGTITLAAPEVVAQQGAKFDISGGSVSYEGGRIYSTRLIGSDGRLYSFDNAPADMKFVAAGGGFVRNHNIQGKVSEQLTEVWTSPLARSSSWRYEAGYTVGRDAGRLNLSTPTSVFEADIIAEVITGERQASARAANVADGYKQVQNAAPLQGTLGLGRYDLATGAIGMHAPDVRFGDVAAITAGLSATDALPAGPAGTAWFDAGRLNAQKLGGLDIATADTVTIDRAITLADGGRINFNAAIVDIKADVTAHGGSLTVDNYFRGDSAGGRGAAQVLLKDGKASVAVHAGATLDLRGVWVNASDNPADITKQAFINGGAVTLRSSHDVTLEKDSAIDVSSGAAILTNGKVKGGRGGDVTLIADQQALTVQTDGLLTLNGEIRAYGVSGGGALKLESGTAIVIGGKALATDGVLGAGEKAPADLVLLQDYLVKAGEVLPARFSYPATVFSPGDQLTSTALIQNVTLAADWTPPLPAQSSGNYVIQTSTGSTFIFPTTNPLPVFPAGTVISIHPTYMNQLAGYTLPAAPFPNGLPSSAPFTRTLQAGTVTPIDGTIAAGTLIGAGSVLQRAAAIKPLLQLDTSRFQSGFSSYDVNGRQGVVVADGARLDVAMPVYRPTEDAFSIATGSNSARVFDVWTPPEWTENARSNTLTQRGGASVTLRSTVNDTDLMTANGPVTIHAGASIRVDAGQSISLQARDFTIDGRLTAPGGTINLIQPVTTLSRGLGGKAGLIWIGDQAVLDVAARAVTATNARGETYGVVGNGGSILIGGAIDWETTGESFTPDAFVVIRAGALLDASGAGAVLDIPVAGPQKTSTPLAVASNGGTIVVKSSNGLYLDGMLRAAAGGANAAGGTLALALEAPKYLTVSTVGDVLRHREFVIADIQGDSAVAGAGSMAQARAGLVTGTARLGVDRVKAGGFGTLSLLSDGLISFDGDVTLAMNQSLSLYAGVFALGTDAGSDARIALAAPYVRLAGVTRIGKDLYTLPAVRWDAGTPTQQASGAVFSVAADLLDIRDRLVFGVSQLVNTQAESYTVDRRGFALLDLLSRGDIRLLGTVVTASGTAVQTPGNITLTAEQIYPATGASATITAGFTTVDKQIRPGSVIDIRRIGDKIPELPYSAFGSLTLAADTINQGGVVRAPFGSIMLGSLSSGSIPQADAVHLLPGSITSVSGAGLVMPYGGTRDGITYNYNSAAVTLKGAGAMGGVSFVTLHLDAAPGAVLDLSGGGQLTGAGFVSGRGGSVNVMTTPFANSNPGYTYSAKGNEVYAIVPSRSGAYAPAVQDAGYALPQVGRQITIPDGVPGLAAGTYTLMPATYALLPGAYRVEIGRSVSPAITGVVAAGNGSHIVSATLGVANTGIRASLPNQVIVTPANVVRTHSSYNEMGYDAFVLADAVRVGAPRAAMTIDARTLDILLGKPRLVDGRSQLTFDGDLRIAPETGSGGFSGTVQLRGISEILATGQTAAAGLTAASVYADDVSKLDAPRLLLNGSIYVAYGAQGRFAQITGDYGDIVLRSGARLSAAEVIFAGMGRPWLGERGAITIEEGASISTVGRGHASFDSRDGYIFVGSGVFIVSNGVIDLVQGEYRANAGLEVDITVGGCVTAGCNRTTTLVSEGTIAVSTAGNFSIASNVSYGTRNLVLGLSALNLGEDASLAAAAAAGRLPAGLSLNQTLLAQLLAGNTATGAPALEALALNARDAVNVFGSVTLDASKVGRLVLGTPAIYGYGSSGDVATIRAGEFVWTGAASAPGAPIADQLGDGRLTIAADRVVFGYGPNSRPSTTIVDNRIALGFANIDIVASERVTSTNTSTLAVYHRQGAYTPGTGYQYTGGNLTITAPLVTGAAGSSNSITAGGDIRIGGGGAAAGVAALGAQLTLTGANIAVDTSVVLPSGRLALAATGDILLGGDSRIDLAGRGIAIFDVTKYSWGGDLILTSSAGNIRQDTGSVIDLSAQYNRGGTATVTALGAGAGHVDLGGTVRGAASGVYDAGGTLVPYDAAEVTVQAQTLADFAGLNARLNADGVFGARRFQIKQGDLVVGSEVKARNVEITLDGGSLMVNGPIDASGYQVGSIRLAAMNDLVINGRLDAHGSGMRFDSYGKAIDAANRASIDLTTRMGKLTLTGNAAFDLRAGTDVAGGNGPGRNDGVARGTLALNAPRVGADDIAVNVQGTPPILGARTVAVYGYRTYDDAIEATVPDVTGYTPQEITQAYLDGIHGDSWSFIEAARVNSTLINKLAGLGNYHLRPGVDIVSKVTATNPNGDLTIAGDLDLSGYRYGVNANSPQRGFGEPGAINFRAAGDLNIRGSINDGFAPPPASPASNGWLLEEGVVPYGGDLVLPIAVTLQVGSVFNKGAVLNYALSGSFAGALPVGTVLPVRATLAGSLALGAGTVVDAAIYHADGTLAYAAGSILTSNVTLTAGMQLDAGTVLRGEASFAALTWPKGVPLPANMTATGALTLAAGSLIPSMTNVKLAGGTAIALRDSSSGANWAIAPMLAAGAASWDMQFTAGADLGSADIRARNNERRGNIILADTHYASRSASGGLVIRVNEAGVDLIVVAAGGLPPGINDKSELVGKSEAEIIALYGAFSWDDFSLPGFWNPAAGNIQLGLTIQGVDAIVTVAGGLPPGINDKIELLNKTQREIVSLYMATSWDEFGLSPNFWDVGGGNATTINLPATTTHVSPSFSVIRTGTGNLSLAAAGNIRMDSLYGVYTAGTATAVDPSYTLDRAKLTNGTLLGTADLDNDYGPALAASKAWYPDQGGNVLIAAGGDLVGDIYGQAASTASASVVTGNWLWRQGTGSAAVDTTIPTSWWINFGTYVANTVDDPNHEGNLPDLVGFTGIGALGGGNIAIRVGGQAGAIALRGSQGGQYVGTDRSQGLVVAVGSTGRVGSDGSLALTGGGDIDLRIAGALNPNLALTENKEKHALPGALIDLRGTVHVAAESIGGLKLIYAGPQDGFDPRGVDPYAATQSYARSGITLTPGDATVTIETRGDLVLGGAGDPGRTRSPNNANYQVGGVAYAGGESWFSLWTDHTAINLISAGGNLTPTTSVAEPYRSGEVNGNTDQNMADGTVIYPSILRAAALGGSIYYGVNALPFLRSDSNAVYPSVTLAPSPYGTLEMLAGNSIYGGQYSFSLSGTGTRLPTAFNPVFVGIDGNGRVVVTNASVLGTASDGNPMPLSLFVFGPNTAALPIGRAADADPVRFYARDGDIVGLSTGETLTFAAQRTWYSAAAPLKVRAGRDIVGAGLAPGVTQTSAYEGAVTRGNLIVHSDPDDVSIISAGRDIVNANFDIYGPGAIEVSAGRNLYQGDKGAIWSKGPVAVGDARLGASIAIFAGVGASGPDYQALASRYLDPVNLAATDVPFAEQPGKVAKTYEKELVSWLNERYGFVGSDTEARAMFDQLAPELRHIFLRNVYFAELTAGGREYNDKSNPRYHNYLRGREAIATLFPNDAGYGGDLTMFGASGVRTLKGGDIQLFTPGGRTVVGIEAQVPPADAGLVTQGDGDIQLYSKGSVLLGLSRIMTTFGGNILAWSAEGDINAGRGSKTTVVFTPPQRRYDNYGNVVLSPQAPASGAGIQTLKQLPEVPPGDVDLIAPLGTIDAGEAGIRVSGNINLAALQIVNAANIQVQGTSSGIPTVQAPSISAALSTSNATAATQQAAAPAQTNNDRPSVIIVEVLGYGGGNGDSAPDDEQSRRRDRRSDNDHMQNPFSPVQVIGSGELSPSQRRKLTAVERRNFDEP